MFDQSHGLRFDIYERVHLSEDVIGIQALEEIELVPHIQVIPLGEQATLRGNLLLTSVYRGEDDLRSTQTLEHWIPVEITLPMNRVQSLDDIAVEIENFDVDLLSTRSLNVTGVLSLKGIEMSQPETPAWTPEEFTVVHQTDPEEPVLDYYRGTDWSEDTGERAQEEIGPIAGSQEQDHFMKVEERQLEPEQEWAQEPEAERELILQTSSLYADKEPRKAFEANETAAEPSSPFTGYHSTDTSFYTDEGNVSKEETPGLDDYALEPDRLIPGADEQTDKKLEEKKEMKVALGSKKEYADEPAKNVGFHTLLQSSKAAKELETRQAVEELEQQAQKLRSGSTGDEVEWKSLFLNNVDEKSAFRKVRICIVQREETLDMIADRYNLNPRELLLYNRLSEQNLSEGQVIYIP